MQVSYYWKSYFRVYISQYRPNDDLKLLTNKIINVYAWFWFAVKAKPEFYNSPRHISNDPKSKCI